MSAKDRHDGGARLPRLPLEVSIDLTYRCNNACRHCWLWTADTPAEIGRELKTDEWLEVIFQARALGARSWSLSGGEPMLREDFCEIFEAATHKSVEYGLNTNGTLITPAIAHLLRRPGTKAVAIYGATAGVYERVTRVPGSFEALLQGLAHLKEAGAGFVAQLVPMKSNHHQWAEMIDFARRWTPHYKVGAPWLYLSALGSPARDAAIVRERLAPRDMVALDPPALDDATPELAERDEMLYACCHALQDSCHIDPYGGMSWCSFVKDPELRWPLRGAVGVEPGAVGRVWDELIPDAASGAYGGSEYHSRCGSCERRALCKWCDVYGYLEHRRHGAPVQYLCELAAETEKYHERLLREHRRFYRLGGMTLRVQGDLPIEDGTFAESVRTFEVTAAEADGWPEPDIAIHHHFDVPRLDFRALGEPVYDAEPWTVYHHRNSWVYVGLRTDDEAGYERVAQSNEAHTRVHIYNGALPLSMWLEGGANAVTLFPSDQIILSRVLSSHGGCVLHSGGVTINGRGLLFLGHSGAGKSTMVELLAGKGEVLCDDRNIVRREADGGFRVYSTWSHGTVPNVNAADAPLAAIFSLRQAAANSLTLMDEPFTVLRELLSTVVRPLATADWWNATVDLLEDLARAVPCYELHFDKTGAVAPLVEAVVSE
jgi:MoaA/NifB/PqqE/SkfB family radical SAM enzyme